MRRRAGRCGRASAAGASALRAVLSLEYRVPVEQRLAAGGTRCTAGLSHPCHDRARELTFAVCHATAAAEIGHESGNGGGGARRAVICGHGAQQVEHVGASVAVSVQRPCRRLEDATLADSLLRSIGAAGLSRVASSSRF